VALLTVLEATARLSYAVMIWMKLKIALENRMKLHK
jgi:hypothetical protein